MCFHNVWRKRWERTAGDTLTKPSFLLKLKPFQLALFGELLRFLRDTTPNCLQLLWFCASLLQNCLRLLWLCAIRLQNAYNYCGFARHYSKKRLRLLWFCAIQHQNTYNYCGFARHYSKIACDYCGLARYESKTLTITEVL